jgi:hypothetical protein
VFAEGWRFDPRFGPDGTDTYVTGSESLLNLELERAGERAVYLPRAVVHHRVRPEQLEPRWLYGRAFRFGRLKGHTAGLSTHPPRQLPRLVLDVGRAYARFTRARTRGDAAATLATGLAYWRLRGMLYQWWRGLPAPRPTSPASTP